MTVRLPVRAGRHRVRLLAVGAALLARAWWPGPGTVPAHAAEQPPPGPPGAVTGAPVALGGVDGGAPFTAQEAAAQMDRLLRDRFGAHGPHLPGHAATVPGAPTPSGVLLPAVPPHPREDGGGASGPVAPVAGPPAAAPPPPARPGRPFPRRSAPAAPVAPPGRSAPDGWPTSRPDAPAGGDGPPGTPLAVAPAVASDTDTAVAVLAPIAAGLLLTGLATYKHRGLPRGH